MSADPTAVVSQDGTPIAVSQSGEGPPLVLIHGAAADHNRWAPVLPGLEERFTVFAIDRRGRGRSGDASDYALEREYDDVVAVVESAGDGASVLGHSYWGICAVEAALLTDRIRKLVLYEPPMRFLKSPSMSSTGSRRCSRQSTMISARSLKPMTIVAGLAHDRDDLLHCRQVGRVAQPLVAGGRPAR